MSFATKRYEYNSPSGAEYDKKPWQDWPHQVGLALVYLSAIWLTGAYYLADMPLYVESLLYYIGGVSQDSFTGYKRVYAFWEFGHLLWRPLGWMTFKIFEPLTRLIVGADTRANVEFTLRAINWLAGLFSVFLLRRFIGRFCKRDIIVNIATVAFIFSQAFLDLAQAGCAYVPGLSLLLLGLYILARDGDKPNRSLRTAVLAGLALAGSVCFWFLYILAIPAALASPLFLFSADRQRWRLALQTTLAFSLITGLVYAIVIAHLGLYNITDLKAWISDAAHTNVPVGGIPHAVFGFARSFINLGNDSVYYKRYLLNDPYNPVSLLNLFQLSSWKLVLFYVFVASLLINLLRSQQGRRIMGLLILNGIPIFAFALWWHGSTVERYMPLYPLIFLSLAYTLSSDKSRSWLKFVTLGFFVVAAVVNVGATAVPVLERQRATTMARVKDLQPLLKPQSWIFVGLDELAVAPDAPPDDSMRKLNIYSFLSIGLESSGQWREDFTSAALPVWKDGGDVWVSKRLFNARPRPEWNWVEGVDPHVSWADFYNFFSQLEMGQSVGGEDGFMLLLPSPQNKRFLSSFVQENTEGPEKRTMN